MYEGMFMYGCVCVSLGDGGSVGSQGKRAAVSRRGRRGCRSPSFSLAW